MTKNAYAAAFALVGAGVGGFISAENGSLVPVIIGLCAGCFVGYFVAGLVDAKSSLLQKGFKKLGDLRGLPLEEIEAEVGAPAEFKVCNITDRNETGTLYTWREAHYEITLLFGADGRCIGVNNETRI